MLYIWIIVQEACCVYSLQIGELFECFFGAGSSNGSSKLPMLMIFFRDVRDWIWKSDKHEFCSFIGYLKPYSAVLWNNVCVMRNPTWIGTGSACYFGR